MKLFSFNRKQQITVGVLIIFLGICSLLSSYFGYQKKEVFNDMNILYYEYMLSMDIELLEMDSDPEIENIPEEDSTTTQPVTTLPGQTTTRARSTTTRAAVDDSRHYIGILSIPKIDLRQGFVDPNSRYNTVNRNIQVITPSNMPNVVNGNLIIAAHAGTSSVSFFKNLHNLEIGDEASITYQGTDYKYAITNIYYVNYTGNIPIRRNANATTLTLITCTRGQQDMQTVYIAELVN